VPTKLKLALQSASATAPCDTVIPRQWPHSLPVPTGAAGGAEFKIFFYPLGRPHTPDFVNAPLGEAVLRSDGSISSCQRLPGEKKGLSSVRWPAATDKLSVDELVAELDRLYAATEEVAVLYAAKAPLTEAAKKTLQDFSRRFPDVAEPVLLSYYYQLNPDFWEWLSKSGAPALAKP
jgi:hypothetical protein